MLKDRFMRIVMSVIAVSLAILALSAVVDMMSSTAQAQRPYNVVKSEGPAMDVLLIRDIPIDGLKEIYIMGDRQTFVVRKSNGFSVYKVDFVERTTK